MTLTEFLMILAILLAPIIAIRIEKWLERQREVKEEKRRVFRILMSTRAARLSPAHVEALNLIDVIFTDKKEKNVREKWKECLDKLGLAPKYPEEKPDPDNPEVKKIDEAERAQYNSDIKTWNDNLDDLMAELLQEMGKTLGYDFDIVHIKRGGYIPKAHSDVEQEQQMIRRGFLRVLLGQWPVPMEVTRFPGPGEEEANEQQALRRLLIANLSGDSPLQVKIQSEELPSPEDSHSSEPKVGEQAAKKGNDTY